MRNRLGPVSLLLFATTLSAQTAAPANPTADAPVLVQRAILAREHATSCPVSLDARRLPFGTMLQAAQTARTHQFALKLTFTPQIISPLVRAKLTLHGFSGDHVISAGSDTMADTTERRSISASLGEHDRSNVTIYPARLSSVKWIELNEIKFSDGTEWHATATSVCRFVPDSFLLVTAAR